MNWIKPHKGVGALFNGKSSSPNNEKTINNSEPYINNSTRNITGNSLIDVTNRKSYGEAFTAGKEILETANTYNNETTVPETPHCEKIVNSAENTDVFSREAETEIISTPQFESAGIGITESDSIETGNTEVENTRGINQTESDCKITDEKLNSIEDNDKALEEHSTNTSEEPAGQSAEDKTSSSVVPFDDLVKFYVSSLKRKRKIQKSDTPDN